jgi:hypothetical protein
MNAKTRFVRKPLMWLATLILVLAAGMVLGGCHKRKVLVLHEPRPHVATHRGRGPVVLVEHAPPRTTVIVTGRGADHRSSRRHRQERTHDHRERPDRRRSDRREDGGHRPRRG